MNAAAREYFRRVIGVCEKNIAVTSDPDCVAGNREAIRVLRDYLCGSAPVPNSQVADSQVRELISSIDGFHGNELKDRSESSIRAEVAAVRRWLDGVGGGAE